MAPDIVRRDAPAAETIERLHAILDSLGFASNRAMVQRWSAGDHCHSCHLRFLNYPLIYANGKGVTPELAYASALAEFIERLQCLADTRFTWAGDIHRLPPFEPERDRTFGEVAAAAPGLAAADLGDLPQDPYATVRCLPFVDVFGERVVDLPYNLLRRMTSSSGMCAGNTPKEAIVHGICEVFERHAIHAVESGLVGGLPTLPLDGLPIRSDVVRRQLAVLASAGTEVIVKDASLGGTFPVVAQVLMDRSAGSCHVSFGSDPVFDAALSRCITEAFQGSSHLFRPFPSDDEAARPLDTYNNLEILLDRLAADVGTASPAGAFCEAEDNQQALRFVLDRVRQAELGLYIRDFSLFGFPTYYIYIEQLSALTELRRAGFSHLGAHHDAVRRTLFRLPSASTEEIESCSEVLFDELTCCNPLLERQFTAAVLGAPVLTCLDLGTLLVLMLLESGSLEKAQVVMDWPPVHSAAVAPPRSVDSVAWWLPSYLHARCDAAGVGVVAANFERAFGPAKQHTRDATPAVGGSLPFPRCVSVYACPSCPCRRACWLDEWYRLAQNLHARAVPARQEELLRRLVSICERTSGRGTTVTSEPPSPRTLLP